MDRRVYLGGGIIVAAAAVFGVRIAMNSGAKSGLDDALNHLPPGFTATHGAVTFNGLTGEARVHDLVVTRNGAPLFSAGDVAVSGIGEQDATGMPKRIGDIVLHDASAGPYKHIERVHLSGLNLENLRQIMDPAAYPGGKPAWTDRRPLLEHCDVHGIEGAQTTPGVKGRPAIVTKFTIGTSTVDGLRASQLLAPPDLNGSPIAVAAAFERSMAEDSASVRDIGFAATGPASVTGHIASGSSGHYDGGRVDRMSLEDVSVTTTTPPGSLVLGGLTARGIDISKMLAALPAALADPATPHPEILDGMHLDTGELHGLKVDYPSAPLVTMQSMSGGSPDRGSSVFAIHGLTIQTSGRPLAPSSRAALDSFGMADFTTDLNEVGAYDPVARQAVLKRCDIEFHDLGTLHLSFTVSGVGDKPVSRPADIQAAIATAKLNAASMTWDDASLVERLLKMTAAKQGLTPDQVRAGLALPLASLPMLMPEQPDAAQQVAAFLDGRHMLKVTLNPPTPVSLAEWSATPPAEKASLLGVHVSGN